MSKIDVLYNGDCPICSREIAAYRAAARSQGLPIEFESLADTDLSRWGLSVEQAGRRLHLLRDGELVSGLDAFQTLWEAIPRLRWLARVSGWPVIYQVLWSLYEWLLAPCLYALHRIRVHVTRTSAKFR